MKLPCSECKKKISIDDAFAGMVCRCPYCRALVLVPEDGKDDAIGGRPEAPGQERPTSPADLKAMADSQGTKVPLADPVKMQGIVTLVMLGVLVLLIAGTVAYFTIDWSGGGGGGGGGGVAPSGFNDGPKVNPFKRAEGVEGEWVLGNVAIRTPVVFVLDGGDSMKDDFDFAQTLSRIAIRDFGPAAKFNILICRDASLEAGGKEVLTLSNDWRRGKDERATRAFLQDYQCRGMSSVVKGLEAALALKPKTVVLFCAKGLGEQLTAATDLMKKARKDGVYLVAVAMQDLGRVKEDLAALAKGADGATRQYFREDLDKWPTPQMD